MKVNYRVLGTDPEVMICVTADSSLSPVDAVLAARPVAARHAAGHALVPAFISGGKMGYNRIVECDDCGALAVVAQPALSRTAEADTESLRVLGWAVCTTGCFCPSCVELALTPCDEERDDDALM